MTVEIFIQNDTPIGAAKDMFDFIATIQNRGLPTVAASVSAPTPAPAATLVHSAPAEAPKKGRGKAKTEETTATTKYTLAQAIERAKDIVGSKENPAHEANILVVSELNERWGVGKVRELPPEKIDGYMAELNARFPITAAKEAAGGDLF